MQNTQHHGQKILRKGARGDDVRQLQQKLQKLGFDLQPDGIFGDATEKAVIQLQTMFGYTVDALVGEGTNKLIDAQIGYGWNVKSPDAAEKAMAAQGKGPMASKPAQGGMEPKPGQGSTGSKPTQGTMKNAPSPQKKM